MADPHLRLRRVRFKNGPTLRVMHRTDATRECRAAVEAVLQSAAKHTGLVGVAIVAWSADGSSTADMVIGPHSPLLSMQVPDFARHRLMAQKIKDWTRQGLDR